MKYPRNAAVFLVLALVGPACSSGSGSNGAGGAAGTTGGAAGSVGGQTGAAGASSAMGGNDAGGAAGGSAIGAGGATAEGGTAGTGGRANTGGAGTAGSSSACASTNERVGWVATLSQIEAGVSGTATMVDDCTIKLEHFNYDGSGIEVYVYAGKGGNYNSGFALSDNILGKTFTDATLTLTLPAGKTLDDVDGIAVWCADVGVSFGDGLFAAP